MTGADRAAGHPDEVSSKSVKARGQENVVCGAKKEESMPGMKEREDNRRQRAVARCLKVVFISTLVGGAGRWSKIFCLIGGQNLL